ncbi:DUF4279 domain-containing protein [Geomonas ferrireducens]|uniref:DUF4279 domain-containing protein n=1 Tax=Geomonas ferrireducens TaxID=2570227 RepID=UPI0010A9464B|nr:DUF4279 domain-containing protein [Geomonas ferrireducens]
MNFDDDYPTCEETSAVLRIFSDEIDPREITELLGVEPSSIQIKGERKYPNRAEYINKENGWFLHSEDNVESKDLRRHLDWLLSKMNNCHSQLRELASKGAEITIFCPWRSASGHGGPTMDPQQMKVLGDLGIEVVFEFWVCDDKE